MNTVIISHRLRGYDHLDASREGLEAATRARVLAVEVDIRFTRDDAAIVHHDARLSSGAVIAKVTGDETGKLVHSKTGRALLSLEEMMRILEKDTARAPEIFLDVKETGFEEYLAGIVRSSPLNEKITVISWLPEVLRKWHELDPQRRLCFSSHLCKNAFIRNTLRAKLFLQQIARRNDTPLHVIPDGYNGEHAPPDSRGIDFEHLVSFPLSGHLRDILRKTGGIICTQYRLLTAKMTRQIHEDGMQVMAYTLNSEADMQKYAEEFHCDYILTDRAELCSTRKEN